MSETWGNSLWETWGLPTISKVEQKIGPAYDGHRDDGKHGSASYSEAGQRMWCGPTWCIPTIPDRQGASLKINVFETHYIKPYFRNTMLSHIFACCLQAFISGNGMDIPSVGFMMLSAQPAWLKSGYVFAFCPNPKFYARLLSVWSKFRTENHISEKSCLKQKHFADFPIRRKEQRRNPEQRIWPHPQKKNGANFWLLLWKPFPVDLSMLLHDEHMWFWLISGCHSHKQDIWVNWI